MVDSTPEASGQHCRTYGLDLRSSANVLCGPCPGMDTVPSPMATGAGGCCQSAGRGCPGESRCGLYCRQTARRPQKRVSIAVNETPRGRACGSGSGAHANCFSRSAPCLRRPASAYRALLAKLDRSRCHRAAPAPDQPAIAPDTEHTCRPRPVSKAASRGQWPAPAAAAATRHLTIQRFSEALTLTLRSGFWLRLRCCLAWRDLCCLCCQAHPCCWAGYSSPLGRATTYRWTYRCCWCWH